MELYEEVGRWMVLMTQYLKNDTLPNDEKDAKNVCVNEANYTMYK